MGGMTNEQYRSVLKLIIQAIEDAESKEEAIEKIEALLKD